MIDPRLEALIQEDVDGVLSAEERRELHERLAADPQAKALHDELMRVKQLLGGLPEVDPPARLREGVMGALESERRMAIPAGSTRRPAWWRRLFPTSAPSLRWATAAAFAGGVLVGLLPLLARMGPADFGPDHGGVTGTLGLRSGAVRPAVIAREGFTAGPVDGRAVVSRMEDRLIVDLELLATVKADLAVSYDPASYRLVGLERGDGGGEVEASAGEIHAAQFTTGSLRIVLEKRTPGNGPPLRLAIRQGTQTYEQTIETHGDRR